MSGTVPTVGMARNVDGIEQLVPGFEVAVTVLDEAESCAVDGGFDPIHEWFNGRSRVARVTRWPDGSAAVTAYEAWGEYLCSWLFLPDGSCLDLNTSWASVGGGGGAVCDATRARMIGEWRAMGRPLPDPTDPLDRGPITSVYAGLIDRLNPGCGWVISVHGVDGVSLLRTGRSPLTGEWLHTLEECLLALAMFG